MDFSNKVILITGGSAGIGKSLLSEFIRRGARNLVIVGRDAGKLAKTAGQFEENRVLTVQGDVSIAADLERIVGKVRDQWGRLDILVNNAGVVSAGLLEEMSDEDVIDQVRINLTGVLLLTKKCLPLLEKSSEGAIINVSSGLGYIANPFYSVYAATKAGVRQFSDAMRRELHAWPVHVMTIYPTATDTPMMTNAKVGNMDDPDEVARRSVDGLLAGEINVIFGGEQRIEDIRTNFLDPEKMDEKSISRYEELKERTKNHRAM